MTFYFLTLFPDAIKAVTSQSILKRAQEENLVTFKTINLRNFAKDKHKTVDDKPYGGGAGMVMKVDVIKSALDSIKTKPYTILLSASGKKYSQQTAKFLTTKKGVALICGHYEGVDARIEKYVDAVYSIGDYVLTGGEIPALLIADSTTRLLPNVIKKESTINESFSTINLSVRQAGHKPSTMNHLLEHPQYTRPENFEGQKVPNILLSGNHKEIASWREKEALKRTKKYRPDLLK